VKRLLVFGSRSLGRYREGSDLDLCLIDGDMPFSELLQLKAQLDDLNLSIHCDVIRFSSIKNEELRSHIHRAGVELLLT
jgi:predicted nucleotidyltransferase